VPVPVASLPRPGVPAGSVPRTHASTTTSVTSGSPTSRSSEIPYPPKPPPVCGQEWAAMPRTTLSAAPILSPSAPPPMAAPDSTMTGVPE